MMYNNMIHKNKYRHQYAPAERMYTNKIIMN
jgi:hypothetical protein